MWSYALHSLTLSSPDYARLYLRLCVVFVCLGGSPRNVANRTNGRKRDRSFIRWKLSHRPPPARSQNSKAHRSGGGLRQASSKLFFSVLFPWNIYIISLLAQSVKCFFKKNFFYFFQKKLDKLIKL